MPDRNESDPIDRTGLREGYWRRVPMERMTAREWEALCDGCGKCCLNKLEDEETGVIELTRVACRLLDDGSCRCAHYENRHQFVPECIRLTPQTIRDHMHWLPRTCGYRLIHEGRDLYPWHPLRSGRAGSVHEAGVSMRGRTVSEIEVADDEWEDHIIEEPV